MSICLGARFPFSFLINDKASAEFLIIQKVVQCVLLCMPELYSLKCSMTKYLVSNLDKGLVVQEEDAAINLLPMGVVVHCRKPIHRWYLMHYRIYINCLRLHICKQDVLKRYLPVRAHSVYTHYLYPCLD